jgi:hypothetical protein
MWRETRTRFITAYDQIEVLAIPSVCDNYVLMVDIILAAFGVGLPWGIEVPGFYVSTGLSVLPQLHFSSSLLLVLNTLMVMLTLFGLNGLAQEIEDPFQGPHIEDSIDIEQAVRVFRTKVDGYQSAWTACLQSPRYGATSSREGDLASQLRGGSRWEVAVQLHKVLCPSPASGPRRWDGAADPRLVHV